MYLTFVFQFKEEQKCKRMVDKITNILRETLAQGSGFVSKSEGLLRGSIPPDGKEIKNSLREHGINTGTTSCTMSHKQSPDFGIQTSRSAYVEKTRPEFGPGASSLPSRSGVGQSSKMDTCSIPKRARTELLDQLNQE